jgi:succinoglycan biosynthesis protein ExoL
MKTKMLFLSDHYLDPRLRTKLKIFQRGNYEITVLEDRTRAPWFKTHDKNSINYNIKDLNTADNTIYKYYDNAVIYISGVKIMYKLFFILIKLKKRNKIYIEIPDLPLRAKNMILNRIIAIIFKLTLRILADGLVITSNGFRNYLPKIDILLFENIMDPKILNKFKYIKKQKKSDRTIIGIVGAIRYYEQLEMIVKFVSEHSNDYELQIYGGPVERLSRILKKYPNQSIVVNGVYSYEKDIIRIYEEINFIYSVYDAEQINVCRALPNKLYEAVLARIPLIVSKNTYLSEIVEKQKLGFSVPFKMEDYDSFKEKIKRTCTKTIEYNFNSYRKIIYHKSCNNAENLLQFIS